MGKKKIEFEKYILDIWKSRFPKYRNKFKIIYIYHLKKMKKKNIKINFKKNKFRKLKLIISIPKNNLNPNHYIIIKNIIIKNIFIFLI